MQKNFSLLRPCPLFDAIADDQLPELLGCLGARVMRFSRDETILAQGDAIHSIGVLLSGMAQIVQLDCFGRRSIVAPVQPAQLFGEAFACAGVEALPVSVVALEDAQVLFIDCQRIAQPCERGCGFHRQIIYNLMRIMAQKNLLFHQKLEITSRRTTREKLLTYLGQQAQAHRSREFDIPYDRQALADYLEVDRSGLSAEISKLRSEGVLVCRRNHFVLLDPS